MKKKVFTETQLKKYEPQSITLPSLSINNFNIQTTMRKKKPNLKLVTKTNPSVNKENKDEPDSDRPLTATLEKPQILDIKFIRQIDMSLIKKEFLSITNLCRAPLTVIKVFDKTGTCERPLSLPSSSDKPSTGRSSKRSQTSLSTSGNNKTRQTTSEKDLKKVMPPRNTPIYKGLIKKITNDTNNNEKLAKIDRGKATSDNKKLIKLSEPCTTCGRPEQPERFHSHPITPLKPMKKMCEPEKVSVKTTVQKPIAMKYKSKASDHKNEVTKSEAKSAVGQSMRIPRPLSGRGPKSLMCYVCGRDFGTASLPLHEPKCLEKWHRENASLPPSQRRKTPTKPDVSMSSDKWNQSAWESCQASLVPCDNCGRTFLPDRLIVHQRSCKNNNEPNRNLLENVKDSSGSSSPNSNVPCPMCGHLFRKRSFHLHKPHAKANCRSVKAAPSPAVHEDFSIPENEDTKERTDTREKITRITLPRKPNMLPCYVCGRLFSINSIYIHEPQCLKKWKIENDQLPLNKKRPEPIRPDIKFTASGNLDFIGTFNRIWENHLADLKECKKCGRSFFSDRIIKHEQVCIGNH